MTRIGSVSSGTMRAEDLIPAFMDELDEIKEALALAVKPGGGAQLVAEVARLEGGLSEIEDRMASVGYYETEDADYDLEWLTEELNDYALPYCYFGAHEGDGSDYGFWPCWDIIDGDTEAGAILKVPAGDPWPEPLPDGTEYVLEVNDHGNTALYTTDRLELWSIV